MRIPGISGTCGSSKSSSGRYSCAMRIFIAGLAAFLFFGANARPAEAWGFEAHKYIIDNAIALLPPEIRPFFEKYRVTFVEHVIDPDLWRSAGWEEESPRHY